MSIKQRPDGTWRARYTDPDGRERAGHFKTKNEAKAWLAETEVSKANGSYVDPRLGRSKLDEWAPRWMDGVRPTLKPSTVAGYESLLRSRILPYLGKRQLGTLRPSDIQTWIGKLEGAGLSPSRIRKAHVVLSMALDAAVRDQVIARNAARGTRLPRIQRREAAYFEPEVVDRIAEAVPESYRLLVTVLGTLGPRFGEVVALERQSVDLLRRRLRIETSVTEVSGRLVRTSTKTHAERSVPLPRGLAAELENHLATRVGPEPTAPLFTGPEGGMLRLSAFYNRVWRPTLEMLGLPKVGLHVLRHSAAARLISAGATPKAVQSVLGHGSAAFTLTVYGHVFDADLDGLADRLDALDSKISRTNCGLGESRAAGGSALRAI